MDSTGTAARPVAPAEFAGLMRRFAPFETKPHLAVAVSGGGDSLALALIANDWARAQGGRITALTVDHDLRPDSAAEAAQVAGWMAARGIPHAILRRTGPRPTRDIQAAARQARYRLLETWCGDQGVFHLLTAHQAEDQAETLLLRLARGSGLEGLAGMAPLVEHSACRVLRPVLTVGRARLRATLDAAGQGWIDDPSNRNPAYARVRWRHSLGALAAEGLTTARLAATAHRLARARIALEAGSRALLARAVTLDPAGFAWLDPALEAAPEEVGLRALAALLATVSGAEFPPRFDRLERLYRSLPQGLAGGSTLGGCRLLPRRGGVLVCREPAAVAAPVAAAPGGQTRWDGRFVLTLPARAPPGLMLGALGGTRLGGAVRSLPAAARAALPALRQGGEVVAVPALDFFSAAAADFAIGTKLCFCPTRPLAGGGFTVV